LLKTSLVNWKSGSLSAVRKSRRFNVHCVQVHKVSKQWLPAGLAERISIVRNITAKELFHFIHFAQISTMHMLKQIQRTVSLASKFGFTVERSFQKRKSLRKEEINHVNA